MELRVLFHHRCEIILHLLHLVTLVHTRTCGDAHQWFMKCVGVSGHIVFGGARRGGEGRVKVHWTEVSFICIWHTSLLCYSDSTIILITVCLPLLPPPPLHPCPTPVSTYKKDRVCIDRFTELSALLFPIRAMKESYVWRHWGLFSKLWTDQTFKFNLPICPNVSFCGILAFRSGRSGLTELIELIGK